MAADKAQSWGYAEDFIAEDEVIDRARLRSEELGITPISPGEGAVLRMLTAAVDARNVAEVGTGAGVSGLWLLSGMNPEGTFTSIDIESEYQAAAREAFLAAGVKSARARLITGQALKVVPRLADSAYDLIFVDADPGEAADVVDHALSLVRSGGLIVVSHALWNDRVADPARRDEDTVAARELGKSMRADDRLVTNLMPVGDGILVGVRR